MRYIFTTTFLFFYSLISFAQIRNSEPQTIEGVIVQGNRIQIPFEESARDIQIIEKNQIQNTPAHSLNELLAFVGGLDLRQRGPFGGQADVSIDGGTFEQSLVLLNGVKLIDDQTAHIMMNIPISIDAIERIEILRGPAARVYGINALTGAINIVTRKESDLFLSVHTYAGSSFQQKEEGDGKGIYGGGGVQVTGNYGDEKQNHLLSLGSDKYNGQRYNTAMDNSRILYNGNYYLHEDHSIQLMGGYIHNQFGANGFYAAPGDKDSEEIDNTTLISISSQHRIGNTVWTPRISHRYNEDDYRYFKHDLNTARSRHFTNAYMMELNGRIVTSIGEFGLGWESRISRINSSNIKQHNRNNHGFYGEYQRRFTEKIISTVGAYLNYNTDYGWQVYPGADVAYFPTENWKFSASVGSGQRIPSFTDLYVDQAPGNVGNPSLQPENAWQYELNGAYTGKNSSFKAGYFNRRISQFIDWVRPDASVPYTPDNLGTSIMNGAYARFSQKFQIDEKQYLGYQLNYNYLSPKFSQEEDGQSKYILASLRHQFVSGIDYTIGKLSWHVKGRYIKRELNDGYVLLDGRMDIRLSPLDVYLDVSNILNATYKEAGAVPMPSRWMSVGLRYSIQRK